MIVHKVTAVVALVAVVGCDRSRSDAPRITETRSAEWARPQPAKDPMVAADPDMRKLLVELETRRPRPLASLGPEEARVQPSLCDAAKALAAGAPLPMATVEDRVIDGPAGPLDVRIYTPKTSDRKPLPVVTYFHGGGFALANLDTYDASARAIADDTRAIVVSADYRHAPEDKFPAAHEDAFGAYGWVLLHASSFGGDPKRIAVAGESAGGNLAANVSVRARDVGLTMPVHMLLVYPVATTAMDTPSYREWANAKPLDRAMMGWFFEQYTRSPEDLADMRLNLVAANLKGLPETTIVLAEIDPLRSDGQLLAERLAMSGVDVESRLFEGVTHEFFGTGAVVEDARAAVHWAGDRLAHAFATTHTKEHAR